MAMADPAYGDGKKRRVMASLRLSHYTVCVSDLWAGGFSSDEEERSNENLDLLASLVEGGGGGEGSGESRETFEEALTKPDDVSLMKG